MVETLDQRRALLRTAMKNDADVDAYRQALGGANEEERRSLARTLPPTRLFTAEGPTLRACYVLAGLGKPVAAAELLAPKTKQKAEAILRHKDAIIESVCDGARDRGEDWLYRFVDALAEAGWWGRDLVWGLMRRLIHEHGLIPSSDAYMVRFIGWTSIDEDNGAKTGRQIADELLGDSHHMEYDFWQLFTTEGCGRNYLITDWNRAGWDEAVQILCREVPGFRDRVLDESLAALLRDFAPRNLMWYHHVHRLLDPTPAEVAARETTYCAILSTTPSTSVGLAQDMLKRSPGIVDVDGFLDASRAVLSRTEKKLVKAQLGLMKSLVKADPEQAGAVSDIVSEVMGNLPLDLVPLAQKLVHPLAIPPLPAVILTKSGPPEPSLGPGPQEPHPSVILTQSGSPSSCAGGWSHSYQGGDQGRLPITSEEEFLALVSDHLEGTGDGADIPRILAWVTSHPKPERVPTTDAVLQRARTMDTGDSMSPRTHLASLVLTRAGEKSRKATFTGYERYQSFFRNEPIPAGYITRKMTYQTYDTVDGEEKLVTRTYRSGTMTVRTHSPDALCLLAIDQTRDWLKKVPRLFGQRAMPPTDPLPPDSRPWEQILAKPGEGRYGTDRVLGDEPKPFWIHPGSPPPSNASFAALALDVAAVPSEFTFRAVSTREVDAYDQIVQWAAWLYENNPDTLAAQYHPLLWTATQVVNVRGVIPLLRALGQTRCVPSGPTYSGLALGLTAKQVDHRAVAAESVASLAESGLLDPDNLSTQISAHLLDGFVMAGRLAESLSDAASISDLAGYRVLQTLSSLLPSLSSINSGVKLVELTAHLASDYGIAVPIPDSLATKMTGNSLMAVALRTLENVAWQEGEVEASHQVANGEGVTYDTAEDFLADLP